MRAPLNRQRRPGEAHAGILVALLSLGFLAAGGAAVVVDQVQRDDDGFVMSPSKNFSTATYAIASKSAHVNLDGPDWVTDDLIGTLRIRSNSSRRVFIGIARETDIARYLGAVDHVVVTDIGRKPHYSARPGGPPRTRPATETFWSASATGTGEQTLEWVPKSGHWNVVVMNADASRGVEADLSIGAELDPLLWIGIGLVIGSALLGAIAALAITAGTRRHS